MRTPLRAGRCCNAEFVADAAERIATCTDGTPNHLLRGTFTLRGITHPLEFPVLIAAKDDGQHLTGQGVLELDRTAYGSHYGSGKLFRSLANTSLGTASISMSKSTPTSRAKRGKPKAQPVQPASVVESSLVPAPSARLSRGRIREGTILPVAPARASLPAGYSALLADIKKHLVQARLRTVLAANVALIQAYWEIGHTILARQKVEGWGARVIDRLSADLREAFPGMSGLSPRNLLAMKIFAREFPQAPIAQQPVAQLPWGHVLQLMQKVKSPAARLWYLRATARFGWSRNVLLNQIKAGAYERAVTEKKTHNFDLALPERFAEQADEMLKSSYNLEFLGLRRAGIEKPGGPTEISRGCSAAEPPDRPPHPFKPRQGRQKILMLHSDSRTSVAPAGAPTDCWTVSGGSPRCSLYPRLISLAPRGAAHVRTKANPISVAAYALQSKLPGDLKGKLPTAKQLANIVRAEMEGEK